LAACVGSVMGALLRASLGIRMGVCTFDAIPAHPLLDHFFSASITTHYRVYLFYRFMDGKVE